MRTVLAGVALVLALTGCDADPAYLTNGTVAEKRLEAAHRKQEKCGLLCWRNVDVPQRPLLLLVGDDGSSGWRLVDIGTYDRCEVGEGWPACGVS